MKTASWIIRRKSDGKVICETFNARNAEALANVFDYEVIPVGQYLATLNRDPAVIATRR